jgi:hypothetical protein
LFLAHLFRELEATTANNISNLSIVHTFLVKIMRFCHILATMKCRLYAVTVQIIEILGGVGFEGCRLPLLASEMLLIVCDIYY